MVEILSNMAPELMVSFQLSSAFKMRQIGRPTEAKEDGKATKTWKAFDTENMKPGYADYTGEPNEGNRTSTIKTLSSVFQVEEPTQSTTACSQKRDFWTASWLRHLTSIDVS